MDLNILSTIEKITLINMLGSIPHQKFCFYHLPTRGRAGIKLGNAWYVSNVSIVFDCSMILYYMFWMFNRHLYAILYYFGTNLLTYSPVPVSVFSLFLSFTEKEYQMESNWPENSRRLFMDQKKPTKYRRWTRRVPRPPRGWRARPTPLGAPPTSWPPCGPPNLFSTPTPLIYSQTSSK